MMKSSFASPFRTAPIARLPEPAIFRSRNMARCMGVARFCRRNPGGLQSDRVRRSRVKPLRRADGRDTIAAGVPPLVARLRAIWESRREAVIEIFPKAPGLPADKDAYMKFVEDIYESDAYHSLSIERYSVTPELIDRMREGSWNPEIDENDRKNRDALAARGYYLAFQTKTQLPRSSTASRPAR
jgi:hypothetical protein